jgi:hypothetical protein
MRKQGVSLIVLSITILVMAILAATAIIALEDSGIIGRAKNTVTKQNYAEEYTRLQVIKNGIMTDNLGTITVEEFIIELKDKGIIENNGVLNADGSTTITTVSGNEFTISQEAGSDMTLEYTGDDTNKPAPAPVITLNKTTLSEEVATGGTKTVSLTATTSNLTGNITWTSSNTNVATVSGTNTGATLTLKTSGTTTITATSGTATATCTVTVTNKLLTTTLSANTLTISNIPSGVTQFAIYASGTLKKTVTTTTVDLSTLGLTNGTYTITVKPAGTGYTSATASSGKTYTVIAFTIAGITSYTRSGSTWTEWVNSSYNTRSAYISSSKVYIGSKYVTTTSSGSTAVSSTATITSGTAYGTYTASSSGASHSGGAE